MEINKILNADVLDIIFDGRNKDYGAYTLRKNYNKRLATALMAMGSILLLFFVSSVLANVLHRKKPEELKIAQEVQLVKIDEPKKQEIIPPVVPKTAAPPKIETVKITALHIVPDEQVKEDEKPPEVTATETAKIGDINQAGLKDDGVVAPPVEKGDGPGPVTAPKVVEEDYTKVFTKVENPAMFQGGLDGWRRFLERNLQYPESATDAGVQGVVRVQMVVDKEGNVTEVKALNDPGDGLAAEAERVIRKGPKWIPAEQNGKKVTYRFIQTITFKIQ